MKSVYVDIRPWNKETAIAAIEAGADAVILENEHIDHIRELGRITVVAPDGDIRLGEDILEEEITSKEDEQRIAGYTGRNVIVHAADWSIIPLENLLAQTSGLFARVTTLEDAVTALGILEKGVDGVVVANPDPMETRKIISHIKAAGGTIALEEFELTEVRQLPLGDRVCVDTCTNMTLGEGMLVGNASDAFFLVHSETIDNPYVEKRPFRVNAGGVHAYIISRDSGTRYLSELKTGDSVTLVNYKGKTQTAIVGRSKIEKRPLLLVEAKSASGKKASLILQNAETINLTTPEGTPVSVVKIKPGDKVLGHTGTAGRHFGMQIDESIEEK